MNTQKAYDLIVQATGLLKLDRNEHAAVNQALETIGKELSIPQKESEDKPKE